MSRPGLVHRPLSVAGATRTIVLVTGGNTGIGYEIVKKLSENKNYQVLLGTRTVRKGEDAAARMGAPINVNPIQLDITDDESIQHCFLTIEQVFGKLDVLIHNAGTAGAELDQNTSLRQMYEHVLSVNVTSAGVLTEKLTPLLEKSKSPRLIFVTSSLGSLQRTLEGGKPPGSPYYHSSKAAVNMLSIYFSKIHPQWRVNTVCPGLRATSLHGSNSQNVAQSNNESDPKYGIPRIVELATAGPGGVTGTFSDKDGIIPW